MLFYLFQIIPKQLSWGNNTEMRDRYDIGIRGLDLDIYTSGADAPGRSALPSFSFLSNDRYSFAFSPNDLSPAKGTCFLAFSFSILVVQISSNDFPLPIPSRGFLGKGSDTNDVGDIGLSTVDL